MCDQAKAMLVATCINATGGKPHDFSLLWAEVSKITFDKPNAPALSPAQLATQVMGVMNAKSMPDWQAEANKSAAHALRMAAGTGAGSSFYSVEKIDRDPPSQFVEMTTATPRTQEQILGDQLRNDAVELVSSGRATLPEAAHPKYFAPELSSEINDLDRLRKLQRKTLVQQVYYVSGTANPKGYTINDLLLDGALHASAHDYIRNLLSLVGLSNLPMTQADINLWVESG